MQTTLLLETWSVKKVISSFCDFPHSIFIFLPSLSQFSFFLLYFPFFPCLSFYDRYAEISRSEVSCTLPPQGPHYAPSLHHYGMCFSTSQSHCSKITHWKSCKNMFKWKQNYKLKIWLQSINLVYVKKKQTNKQKKKKNSRFHWACREISHPCISQYLTCLTHPVQHFSVKCVYSSVSMGHGGGGGWQFVYMMHDKNITKTEK